MWKHKSHTKVQLFAKQRHYLHFSVIFPEYRQIHRDVSVYIFVHQHTSQPIKDILEGVAVSTNQVQKLKSWLRFGVCASFSSLQSVTQKIAAIKNCKIFKWQNINDLIHSTCKFWSFLKKIALKLFGISGSNFQR